MMIHNSLPLYLFGVLAYFAVSTEAIIGGSEATEQKQFRYMVSLLQVGYGHVCGGALTGKQHVLTAAHCFVNPDNTFKSMQVFALMGTNDLFHFHFPSLNLEVVKVYVPKEYNASDINTTGDIAVLKLRNSFDVASRHNLKTAKLELNQKLDHSGQKATIAGWGWNYIQENGNEITGFRTDPLLRYATADVYSYHHCQQEHSSLKIYHEHICAKVEQHEHEYRGVCQGDDGSPLISNGFFIGILSKFPRNCVETTLSSIYTRVSSYLTFIENVKNDYVTKNMRAHVLSL